MGFLSENCILDRLSEAVINKCLPYKCSKDADIDSFFHYGTQDNYLNYNEEMMAYSHCLYTTSDTPQMVCAFSLSNTSLRTVALPKDKRNKFNRVIPNNKRRSQYPAILIGNLCVFDDFRHYNIGKELLDLIKTMAVDSYNLCAARYLIVDAINKPQVLSFYKENAFDFLFSSEDEERMCINNNLSGTTDNNILNCHTRLMYFDLIVLKQ